MLLRGCNHRFWGNLGWLTHGLYFNILLTRTLSHRKFQWVLVFCFFLQRAYSLQKPRLAVEKCFWDQDENLLMTCATFLGKDKLGSSEQLHSSRYYLVFFTDTFVSRWWWCFFFKFPNNVLIRHWWCLFSQIWGWGRVSSSVDPLVKISCQAHFLDCFCWTMTSWPATVNLVCRHGLIVNENKK